MKNAFGYEIPLIKKVLTDSKVKEIVSFMLVDVLNNLGLTTSKSAASKTK